MVTEEELEYVLDFVDEMPLSEFNTEFARRMGDILERLVEHARATSRAGE